MRFPDRETAQGIAGKLQRRELLEASTPQIIIDPALHYPEKSLFVIGLRLNRSLGPISCCRDGLRDIPFLGRIRRAVVERHDDIGAEFLLDIDDRLRREPMFRPVDRGAKLDAFRGKLHALS